MHLPQNIRSYIVSLYGKLRGKVKTCDWETDSFSFNKGVFQGDPLSPIIFLICFNPIIETLKEIEGKFGFSLNGERVITLPFADDFNLITTDKRRHQKIIDQLLSLTQSMGLKLKPKKCKSLSIQAGRSTDIEFRLGNDIMKSILHERHHKFLGASFTFDVKGGSIASVIYDRFRDGLENINKLLIRDEFKARIYSEYFLGSQRFLFSVHDLTKSQIKKLDELTHSFLKSWLGIPRGGSWCLVHDRLGLNIKSISHLYHESRALSLANIRVFGDARVRHALDAKESRESAWSRKYSSAIMSRDIVNEINFSPPHHPPSPPPPEPNTQVPPPTPLPPVLPPSDLNPEMDNSAHDALLNDDTTVRNRQRPVSKKAQLKLEVQRGVQLREDEYWNKAIQGYVMQGDFLRLLKEEATNLTWKSFIWGVPRGVARFAINAGLNTLPTADNLKRWGKRTSDSCQVCAGQGKQTLNHVLSSCRVALEQGRFTFRHDSVLRTIVDFVSNNLKEGFSLHSDLTGQGAVGGGTLPPDIITTTQKPDLVIVNRALQSVIIFELTVPWDGNVITAHNHKTNKYASLLVDLSNSGYTADLYCFEVSVRGQITKDNFARLRSYLYKTVGHSKLSCLLSKNISKAAILGSFSIFAARNEPIWSVGNDLSVQL